MKLPKNLSLECYCSEYEVDLRQEQGWGISHLHKEDNSFVNIDTEWQV